MQRATRRTTFGRGLESRWIEAFIAAGILAARFEPARFRHARSKRSAFITLVQAATKSCTNFSRLSSCA